MEEKENIIETEKKLSPILITIGIIVIILSAIAGWYLQTKNVFENPKATESEIIEGNDTNNNEKEEKKLTINDDIVKELYNMIPVFDTNYPHINAYQNKKVTLNELNPDFALAFAYDNTEITPEDISPYPGLGEEGYLDGWYTFKAELVQETAKKIYGTEITLKGFWLHYGDQCGYENGIFYRSYGGGNDKYFANIRNIENVYEEEQTIYIEDLYLFANSEGELIDLYDSSNKAVKIQSISKTCTLYDEECKNEVLNQYKNLMVKYKHTFKKNTDGSYYWYSTEKIEE